MELGHIYFEKYKILEVIGQGGTSEVYLAQNIKLGNRWAIKKTCKGSEAGNLLAEPNILKNLDHFAIPKIIDIEEDQTHHYIIEEYVEGTNLKAYKANHPILEITTILQWAIKLCDVLIYLHSRIPYPIIYRDMKPENIMLMADGKIKLVDFGIAREFKIDAVNDTVPIGTKGYAAPEQYGIGQSDERTDIFSLGMTLYYLLTNKNLLSPPYHIQWTEQLNTENANALLKVVLKCCEILPSNRYQTVAVLQESLLELMCGKAVVKESEKAAEPIEIDRGKRDKMPEVAQIHVNKTVTIGILGVSPGVGVTHAVIMLAQSLAKKSKVALVELNESQHFKAICRQTQDLDVDAVHSFCYNKVTYYWGLPYSTFVAANREQFDFVILDLGDYDAMGEMDEFVRADIKIVVGHGMDWKIGEIERFHEKTKSYDPNSKWIYLIPFMDKKSIKDVKDRVGNRAYPLGFNMDPFQPGGEVKKVFEYILCRQ